MGKDVFNQQGCESEGFPPLQEPGQGLEAAGTRTRGRGLRSWHTRLLLAAFSPDPKQVTGKHRLLQVPLFGTPNVLRF